MNNLLRRISSALGQHSGFRPSDADVLSGRALFAARVTRNPTGPWRLGTQVPNRQGRLRRHCSRALHDSRRRQAARENSSATGT